MSVYSSIHHLYVASITTNNIKPGLLAQSTGHWAKVKIDRHSGVVSGQKGELNRERERESNGIYFLWGIAIL